MIGYWQNPVVCLSIRLSVCLSEPRCAFWLSRLVYMAKSCTSVFRAGMFFLYDPSDTFAVDYIVYPQNAPQKTSLRKREREFVLRPRACIGFYTEFIAQLRLGSRIAE